MIKNGSAPAPPVIVIGRSFRPQAILVDVEAIVFKIFVFGVLLVSVHIRNKPLSDSVKTDPPILRP